MAVVERGGRRFIKGCIPRNWYGTDTTAIRSGPDPELRTENEL